MSTYGDEEFIQIWREAQEFGRNTNIQKGYIWLGGDKLLFSEREIIKKKLWMWLPNDFELLEKELRELKYPNENRPDIIYTNDDTTINVSFSYPEKRLTDEQKNKICIATEQVMRLRYSDESILDTGAADIGENKMEYLIFVAPAMDALIYNHMYFLSLNERLLIGNCNCMMQDSEDWKELFKQMIASIRIAER